MKRNLILMLACLLCIACTQELPSASDTLAPAQAGARLPRLSIMPQQGALMSWVEPVAKGHVLKFAIYQNNKWVRSGEVVRGENWFVNWADMPSVVAIDDHFWLAHWLVKQTGGKGYDYDIWVAVSTDAGKTWGKPSKPHRDHVAAEHGFVTFFKDGEGAGAVWLDGREYVEKKDAAKNPNKSGNFSLRYTHIQRDGSFGDERVIDNNTCTCCWTSVAVTPNGAVAAWRGRTDNEIRDNKISLLRDGRWSSHKPLGAEGWQIDGCPVNGPTVVARGMQVAAAWFTGAANQPRVRAAFSNDGGLTFGKPIDIDTATPLGRIGLVWRDDQTVAITWMTSADISSKRSSLVMRLVKVDGKLGDVKQVVALSTGRDTGVPQLAATENGVLLAWTIAEPPNGIKTLLLPWSALDKQSLLQKMHSLKDTFFAAKPTGFLAYVCGGKH